MIFLGLIFLTILLLVFGILMLMTRPDPRQKALERRMATVVSVRETGPEQDAANLLLEAPTASAWSEKLPGTSGITRRMRLLILRSQKQVSLDSITAVAFLLGFVLVLVTYLITSTMLLAIPAGVLGASLPLLWLQWHASRRLTAFNAVLPDSIETCARSLRAGHSILAAIEIVSEISAEPAKTEFAEVFKKQNYGLPLRDALMQMLERVPSSDLQVMVTGILVQKDTGGNLAEILDRSAAVIRDRVRIHGEIRTHTAQGRLTGWILVLLPVVMLLTINLINPGYSKVLFEDPLGKKLLYAGVGLLAVGTLIIRQIVHGIEV